MIQKMQRGAQISDCERYRYNLYRGWGTSPTSDPRFALWVMLNPSTADGTKDDATVRKCIGFTKELLGYNAIWIVNLFAFRSRMPELLLSTPDPVGPMNTRHISMLAVSPFCAKVIAAWGSLDFLRKKIAADTQARWVMELLTTRVTNEDEVVCLGTSKSGYPRHPSRIGYDTQLVPFILPEVR